MHRRHRLFYAFRKSTSEVTTLGRDRVLLGMREREARWEIHHFTSCNDCVDDETSGRTSIALNRESLNIHRVIRTFKDSFPFSLFKTV